MKTYHIHIKGLVQGVGFRPHVFRVAHELGIQGEVYNSIDGVHIHCNENDECAEKFYRELIKTAPAISVITSSSIGEVAAKTFQDFKIIESEQKGQYQILITPDFALCAVCLNELEGKVTNRREGYPFITCTTCGPRYSIINRLPYDRENTSMKNFEMCATCGGEYNSSSNRRHFSQTNSCRDCGIGLWLDSDSNKSGHHKTTIEKAVQLLEKGKILAVKGIGGFHLLCDAANKESINRLRMLKQRPSKPFALMYPNLEMLREDVSVSEAEEKVLTSVAAPIVLLQLKEKQTSAICLSEIAPGMNQIGIMLPYTPVHELALKGFNKPVIATSANISNAPIIYREEPVDELNTLCDDMLVNNREIVVPQDDSVVKFSAFESQKIVIRRSRGHAPTYINPHVPVPTENILALGALLKSTFALTHRQNIYISQYLGDLDNYDVQKNYRHCLTHFHDLLDTKPEVILTDKHPDYYSTSYGLELAEKLNVPVRKYQHHEAHFAAVLGENNLINHDKPVLGIIWDGAGLGNDGNIWGGEFFLYENHVFQRCNHFEYFQDLLGDKMAREPRISALAATSGLEKAEVLLSDKFSRTEWSNYHKILSRAENVKTSSVGRLFDAVASLLGVSDVSTYEGEAAMYLENLAESYFRKHGFAMPTTYFVHSKLTTISSRKMLDQLIEDITMGVDKGFVAAKFHFSLASLILRMAKHLNVMDIALSGGVFQNGLLIDLIKKIVPPDFTLYLHKQLSPNDESISFGQLCCYSIEEQRKSSINKESRVLSHSG